MLETTNNEADDVVGHQVARLGMKSPRPRTTGIRALRERERGATRPAAVCPKRPTTPRLGYEGESPATESTGHDAGTPMALTSAMPNDPATEKSVAEQRGERDHRRRDRAHCPPRRGVPSEAAGEPRGGRMARRLWRIRPGKATSAGSWKTARRVQFRCRPCTRTKQQRQEAKPRRPRASRSGHGRRTGETEAARGRIEEA